jgi:hypothetical protein
MSGSMNTDAERRNVLNLIQQNLPALRNAPNRTFTESALLTAQRLEPANPRWPVQLGQMYGTASQFPNLSDLPLTPVEAAAKAVESYERALALGDRRQFTELAEFARRANLLDKATSYAGQAMQSGVPDYIHEANSTLGHVALQKADVESAKKYLLASSQVGRSPALSSFGPNMNLASELLRRGERETVIAYLEACLKFWTSGEEQLNVWIQTLRGGGTPNLRSSTGR